MVLHILTSVAQWEHEAISERTAAALAAKRARGERFSGEPPIGYRYEGDRVVVNAAEMHMVAALRRYRSWGLSLRWIANRLYEDGYRNRRGGRIHFTQVARILARAPRKAYMPDPESTPPRAVRIDPAVYRCLARAAAAAGMSRAKLGRALVAHGAAGSAAGR